VTRGEYLRARLDVLNKKMAALATKVIESAYEEVPKYYFGCGKYAALKGERDTIEAELKKLNGPDEDDEDVKPEIDDDDDAPNVRRQPKPVARMARGWGG